MRRLEVVAQATQPSDATHPKRVSHILRRTDSMGGPVLLRIFVSTQWHVPKEVDSRGYFVVSLVDIDSRGHAWLLRYATNVFGLDRG
jgi:hypothetical protein